MADTAASMTPEQRAKAALDRFGISPLSVSYAELAIVIASAIRSLPLTMEPAQADAPSRQAQGAILKTAAM